MCANRFNTLERQLHLHILQPSSQYPKRHVCMRCTVWRSAPGHDYLHGSRNIYDSASGHGHACFSRLYQKPYWLHFDELFHSSSVVSSEPERCKWKWKLEPSTTYLDCTGCRSSTRCNCGCRTGVALPKAVEEEYERHESGSAQVARDICMIWWPAD